MLLFTDILRDELKKARFHENMIESTSRYFAKMCDEIESVAGVKIKSLDPDIPSYRISRPDEDDCQYYSEWVIELGKQSMLFTPSDGEPYDIDEPEMKIVINKIQDYRQQYFLTDTSIETDSYARDNMVGFPLGLEISVLVTKLSETTINGTITTCLVEHVPILQFLLYLRRYEVSQSERNKFNLSDGSSIIEERHYKNENEHQIRLSFQDENILQYCLDDVPKHLRKTTRKILNVFKKYYLMLQ